jgi:hypothetical protein
VRTGHPQTDSRPRQFVGYLAVLVFTLLCVRWFVRPTVHQATQAPAPPQINVPAPAADPNAALPHATAEEPQVAEVEEMGRAWMYKNFIYKNRASGENVPAVVVRLPTGSASQSASYWAFSLNAPSGNCRLEYITNLRKLKSDYGFHEANHAMVGNPCSRTVYDPLKLMNLPAGAWARGAIVQGSDLRPPLGIEVQVRGKQILAARME